MDEKDRGKLEQGVDEDRKDVQPGQEDAQRVNELASIAAQSYTFSPAETKRLKQALGVLVGLGSDDDKIKTEMEKINKLMNERDDEEQQQLRSEIAKEIQKQNEFIAELERVARKEKVREYKREIDEKKERFDTNIKEFVGALKKETGVLEDLTKDIKDGKEIDLTALDQLKLSDEIEQVISGARSIQKSERWFYFDCIF